MLNYKAFFPFFSSHYYHAERSQQPLFPEALGKSCWCSMSQPGLCTPGCSSPPLEGPLVPHCRQHPRFKPHDTPQPRSALPAHREPSPLHIPGWLQRDAAEKSALGAPLPLSPIRTRSQKPGRKLGKGGSSPLRNLPPERGSGKEGGKERMFPAAASARLSPVGIHFILSPAVDKFIAEKP